MNEEDEFYSSIKLVTGEELFAIVTTDPEAPNKLILPLLISGTTVG